MFPSRPDMITTYKKRTASQAQFKKSELTVRESKDKIVSTVSFSYGEIRTMDGFETINDQMIPSNKHPFDHFLCITEIRPVKKWLESKKSKNIIWIDFFFLYFFRNLSFSDIYFRKVYIFIFLIVNESKFSIKRIL